MSDELFRTDAEAVAEFQAMMQDPAARQAFVEAKAQAAKTGAKVRYSHILRLVSETPWAIRPSMLAVIVDVLALRVAGGRLSAEEISERVLEGRRQRPSDTAPVAEAVAVLPIEGVIVPKATAMTEMSGGTSLDEFRGMFRQALADPAVKAIVLDVNSPGGMVPGVPEMAAEIRGSRGAKPIVAVANHEAASAAYWLAAQADKFYVEKSGRVGSIGVYTTHENRQGEAAAKGVQTTLISAGEYKTEGNPYEPLTDDAKAYMQSMVDEFYGMFVSDVAKGRGVDKQAVIEGFGQGREVLARAAARAGMVDGVASLESVVRALLGTSSPKPLQAASADGNSNGTPPLTTEQSDGMTALEFFEQTLVSSHELEPPYITRDEARDRLGLPPFAESEGDTEGDIEAVSDDPEAASKQVDNSEWDGNRAMTECDSAADYRSICAGEHTYGEPDERRHWALPHHYVGKGPNAAGVRNALSRLPQAEQLANREAAQRHLDAHMRQINPQGTADVHEESALEYLQLTEPETDGSEQMAEWLSVLDRADARLAEYSDTAARDEGDVEDS